MQMGVAISHNSLCYTANDYSQPASQQTTFSTPASQSIAGYRLPHSYKPAPQPHAAWDRLGIACMQLAFTTQYP